MKVHPRYWIVARAETELSSKILETMIRIDENEENALTVNE